MILERKVVFRLAVDEVELIGKVRKCFGGDAFLRLTDGPRCERGTGGRRGETGGKHEATLECCLLISLLLPNSWQFDGVTEPPTLLVWRRIKINNRSETP